MRLAACILLLSLLATAAFAQPPSAPVIRNDVFGTDGSSKLPSEVSSLPATPCVEGTSVIMDQAGELDSNIYVCDDRGSGALWYNVAAVVSVTNERSVYIPFWAGAFEVDGTVCQEPDTLTITTQNAQTAKHRFVQCTSASTSGKITMSVGLGADVKAGTTIDVWLQGLNNNGTPSGSIDFDVWAKCEDANADLATVNFGTAQKVTLEFSGVTTDRWVQSGGDTPLTLTAGGTCGAYSRLTVQMKMLAGAGESDAVLTDTYIVQLLAAYTSIGF